MEDLDHLLQQCLNAKEVWQTLNRVGVCCNAGDKGFQDWLQQNLAGTHDDPDWPTKFAITLWYI